MCENEFSHISLLLYISTAFSLSLRESEVRALVGSLRKSPRLLACRRKSRWRLSGRSLQILAVVAFIEIPDI